MDELALNFPGAARGNIDLINALKARTGPAIQGSLMEVSNGFNMD